MFQNTQAMPPSYAAPHEKALSCRLSCRPMQAPVLATDGYSYERDSFAQWLEERGPHSPVTGRALTALPTDIEQTSLIERYAVRNALLCDVKELGTTPRFGDLNRILRCPITLDAFEDPVQIGPYTTLERRSAVLLWKQKLSLPTGVTFRPPVLLVPNLAAAALTQAILDSTPPTTHPLELIERIEPGWRHHFQAIDAGQFVTDFNIDLQILALIKMMELNAVAYRWVGPILVTASDKIFIGVACLCLVTTFGVMLQNKRRAALCAPTIALAVTLVCSAPLLMCHRTGDILGWSFSSFAEQQFQYYLYAICSAFGFLTARYGNKTIYELLHTQPPLEGSERRVLCTDLSQQT